MTEIGNLLNESHESLRYDYQVSCDELDTAVESARNAGALGARMTGGGFGGSAIALVHLSTMDGVKSAVTKAFANKGWQAPRIFIAEPSAGAGREDRRKLTEISAN
jgi:galactokinase